MIEGAGARQATVPARLPARASKDVAKYLLDDEEPVLTTRRHWAVLIEPTAKFLPAVLTGGWLFLLNPDREVISTAGLVLVVLAAGYYALRVAEWWMRHFIVSKRRVLLTSGVIVRTVTLLPLQRITDLTWQETLVGQVLGYGTFRFESAGQDQALRHLTFMPDAQGLYREVSRLLFGSDYGGAAGGDDEGNPQPPTSQPPPAGPPGTGRRATEPIDPGPPQPGSPQPAPPQPGTPQHGTPQPGTPQPETPQPGTPQPPSTGRPQRGASRSGPSRPG